jgi:hypothetical protein
MSHVGEPVGSDGLRCRVPRRNVRATFYAYGELLLHDQDVYEATAGRRAITSALRRPVLGNYGLTYSGLRSGLSYCSLRSAEDAPAVRRHRRAWTGPVLQRQGRLEQAGEYRCSMRPVLAATIAYGHIGWLVEEAHGIRQTAGRTTCSALQSRYAMLKPREIRYRHGS